jgi:phosphoenolpyruvate-protein kinase (PTS system EI component)
MAQGEYTSNAASSTFQGAASGAAMGSVVPGIGTVAGAVVGGLIGLGKGLVENSAAKKRARKVQKQKDRLKDAKNRIKGTLQTIPDIFQESQNIQEQQIDKESQSIVENFIEQTVGQISNLEDVQAKTGLTSSNVTNQITSAREKSGKTFQDLTADIKDKKEMLDYDTERQKTAAIQGILSEMYDIDTTIESL